MRKKMKEELGEVTRTEIMKLLKRMTNRKLVLQINAMEQAIDLCVSTSDLVLLDMYYYEAKRRGYEIKRTTVIELVEPRKDMED